MENYCWSYCISSTAPHNFVVSLLSLCVCLHVSLRLFLFFLISPSLLIPQTHAPLHCLTNLSSGRKDWVKKREGERERKKLTAVVGICVSWTNRLHMLLVMVQDVAHLIYTAFIFLFPSALLPYLPALTIFCPVLYWSHSFTLWCSILCFSTTPDVEAKLDFGNVLQRVAPVLNPKRVRCVAMSLLTFLVCCSSENVSARAWQFDFIPWLIAAIMQTSKLRSLANTRTHLYTHIHVYSC